MCIMSNIITERRNFSKIRKRKCKYYKVERIRRLSHQQYPWAWIILSCVSCRILLPRNAISSKYKNENVNTVHSLEADRIEQEYLRSLVVRVLSKVKHSGEIRSVKCVLTFVKMSRGKKSKLKYTRY